MINHFLRQGGVNTLEEFYQKFPTKHHFDNYIQMKYGGGIYAYAPGGETGDESSEAKPSTYGGVSIVDLLVSKGKASNMASRKKLAESLGMTSYTGKPSENKALIDAINSKPELLDKYEAVAESKRPAAKTKSMSSIMQKEQWHAPMLSPGQQPPFPGMPFLGANLPVQQPVKKAAPQKVAPQKTTTPVSGTKADARYLESGMIEDKNKNVMYVVKGGKVVKTFPIMTGKTRNSDNPGQTVEWLDKHPDQANLYKTTPTGTYLSVPRKDIYGKPGFMKRPIAAFGQPAVPVVGNLGQHVIYGTGPKGTEGYDPREGARRTKIMKGPGEQRNASYGCTNMYGQDIDCLTGQMFPQGDTTITIDTRRPMDQQFLQKKYGIKKMGGEPCYECGGMYESGGMHYYADGGEDGPGHEGDWYIGGYKVPSWLKATTQIIDPTGATSWGDAGRAIKEAYYHPSWGNIGTATLEGFGALPVIGKFGKLGKGAKYLAEMSKTAKTAETAVKSASKAQKLLEAATDAEKAALAIKAEKKAAKAAEAVRLAEAAKAAHAAHAASYTTKASNLAGKVLEANPIYKLDQFYGKQFVKNFPKAYEKVEKFTTKVPRITKAGQTITEVNRIKRFGKGLGVLGDAAGAGYDYATGNDEKKMGGQTLHPGGNGTYYQGNFFDDGGTFIPDYTAAAYGELPQYELGKAMYGSGVMEFGGPTYSDVTQYNHQGIVPAFDWMQDGGSPLYSTQGQQLRNFMNTVGYTPGGWMPNHIELPPVGKYDDGGMAPDQQQGPVGTPGQGGGGIDPQQVMQIAAQKLQQGEQPEQVMQELVQAGVPQDMAQQIIQQVMQQLQAAQGQQAAEEMMENPQEQNPQEELEEGQAPQAMYGLGMKYGGSTKKRGKLAKSYEVGGEYEMSDSDIQKLIAQGYKIEYL